MKLVFPCLAALLAAGPALAQAPKPAQVIALDEHSTVGGVLALPNHNTVLLLTSSVRPEVVAQCLAPDGHTLWKTTLTRYQHSDGGSSGLFDMRDIAIGQAARSRKQLEREVEQAKLWPLDVCSDGNSLVLAETISADVAKKSTKQGKPLQEGQVAVQRLDAEGHLSQHLFEGAPAPETRRLIAQVLGSYADAGGYVEVVREENTREETFAYRLDHYDLATKRLRSEPLTLPVTPKRPGGMALRHWYQDWTYLGRRAGQTYFCRRTMEDAGGEKARELPCNLEVRIVDDHGSLAAPGGFRTALALDKGSRVAYSGYAAAPGEARHIYSNWSMPSGKSYINVDEYDVSSGGMGAVRLDQATGDVQVMGEYALADSPTEGGLKVDGLFARRYAPDGRLLASVQFPFTDEMRDFGRGFDFKGALYRRARLQQEPLTGQLSFHTYIAQRDHWYDSYRFHLSPALKLVRYDHPHKTPKGDKLTNVRYAHPSYYTNTLGAWGDVRTYDHAAPTDAPVYAALARLRGTAPEEAEYYTFHLSPTTPGQALVVEQLEGMGGKLNVYTF